jgi:hypothetical protein
MKNGQEILIRVIFVYFTSILAIGCNSSVPNVNPIEGGGGFGGPSLRVDPSMADPIKPSIRHKNPDMTEINSTTELLLSWEPGNNTYTKYRIAYAEGTIAPVDCVGEGSLEFTTASATLTLSPWTEYSIRICTASDNFTVSSGITFEVTTLPECDWYIENVNGFRLIPALNGDSDYDAFSQNDGSQDNSFREFDAVIDSIANKSNGGDPNGDGMRTLCLAPGFTVTNQTTSILNSIVFRDSRKNFVIYSDPENKAVFINEKSQSMFQFNSLAESYAFANLELRLLPGGDNHGFEATGIYGTGTLFHFLTGLEINYSNGNANNDRGINFRDFSGSATEKTVKLLSDVEVVTEGALQPALYSFEVGNYDYFFDLRGGTDIDLVMNNANIKWISGVDMGEVRSSGNTSIDRIDNLTLSQTSTWPLILDDNTEITKFSGFTFSGATPRIMGSTQIGTLSNVTAGQTLMVVEDATVNRIEGFTNTANFPGIRVEDNAQVDVIEGMNFLSTGSGDEGLIVSSENFGTLRNSFIQTEGANSSGIELDGGTIELIEGTRITTSGSDSNGISVLNGGAVLGMDEVIIERGATASSNAQGIYVADSISSYFFSSNVFNVTICQEGPGTGMDWENYLSPVVGGLDHTPSTGSTFGITTFPFDDEGGGTNMAGSDQGIVFGGICP